MNKIMPEDNLTSETLPGISPETTTTTASATAPAPTPEKNESAPTGNPDSKTPLLEKIRRAGANVFERHGITFKAGRGRPRADGQPRVSDVPLTPLPAGPAPSAGGPVASDPPPAAPLVPAAVVPADSALFTRSVISAVKGILGFAKSLCRKKAGQAGLDREFTERALRESEPDAEVFKDFSDSLETVLKKYNVSTEYTPEIALAVSAARLAAPYWLLLQTFNAEIERRRKMEFPQPEKKP